MQMQRQCNRVMINRNVERFMATVQFGRSQRSVVPNCLREESLMELLASETGAEARKSIGTVASTHEAREVHALIADMAVSTNLV